jgi:hypothetical protein
LPQLDPQLRPQHMLFLELPAPVDILLRLDRSSPKPSAFRR